VFPSIGKKNKLTFIIFFDHPQFLILILFANSYQLNLTNMPTNLSRLLLPLTLALLINPACNKKLPSTATSIPLVSQARNFFDDSIAKMIKSKFDAYQFVGQFVMSGLLILLFFCFM